MDDALVVLGASSPRARSVGRLYAYTRKYVITLSLGRQGGDVESPCPHILELLPSLPV